MVRTAAGRPARVVEVKLRPQIRGTDLKVLGFTTSVPRSRAAVPCLPACRVFSLQATRLVSSTRRDRRWARQQQHAEPRTPSQPGLEAMAAVLHSQAGPARYSIYTYHTMNGTNRTALTIYAAAGLCPARLRHGSRRRGAPLIDYEGGDYELLVPLVGRTRRVGGHLSVALSFKHCEIRMKINAGPSGFEPETAGFLSMRR
jgi:hypothetical protein